MLFVRVMGDDDDEDEEDEQVVTFFAQPSMFVSYYRPQRSCEGYVFTGVCLSTDQTPPTPLGADTPPGADTPQEQTPPKRRPLLRTVRTLLECILV